MYKVTQDHIDKGCRNSTIACPIALCLREHVNSDIKVSRGHMYSPKPLTEYAEAKQITTYSLSTGIQWWIDKFDMGRRNIPEIDIQISDDYVHLKGEIDVC